MCYLGKKWYSQWNVIAKCNSIWEPTLIRQNIVCIDEIVEFEKPPVQIQDFTEITDHFNVIYGVYL